MVRLYLKIGLCVFVLLLSAFGVVAQDEEPTLLLQVLNDGEVVSDALSSDVQARLYAFNASEGDVLTVSMVATGAELDPFVVVLGPAGEVIASDDDSGEVMFDAYIEDVTLPASGTYFVLATSFEFIDDILEFEGDDTELGFDLTISGITGPSADVEAGFQYFAGKLTPGEVSQGVSSPEEPVFFYTYVGTAGEIIDLSLSSDEFDTILHVFAPGGNRIAVNDDADGTNSVIEGLELPEDGVYLVFATDIFFYAAGDPDGIFTFTGGAFTIELASR